MSKKIDDVFHVELKKRGIHEEKIDVYVRFSKEHPWYKNLPDPSPAHCAWSEMEGFYYTSDKIVLYKGREYRELMFPCTTSTRGSISHIKHLEKIALEKMFITWIKHQRNENKEKEKKRGTSKL